MALRVKVDEDLPAAALRRVRDAGYDATGVVEQGMQGWEDARLWQVVQSERRFLITADKGFADARFYPPGTHAGVLLLRPDEEGVRPLVELLDRVLRRCTLDDLSGTIAVATQRGLRIRRKPQI